LGNKEAKANGKSDSYFVAGSISANWDIIKIIGSSVGQLDHTICLAHFKVLFGLFQRGLSLRIYHHLPLDDCRQRLSKNLSTPSSFSSQNN
jgi:hypothetical protein